MCLLKMVPDSNARRGRGWRDARFITACLGRSRFAEAAGVHPGELIMSSFRLIEAGTLPTIRTGF